MKDSKENFNYKFTTLFLVIVALFLFSFASSSKIKSEATQNSLACLFINIHSDTQAVIPTAIDLPICASFTDQDHSILDLFFITSYSINLRIDSQFSSARKKHLLIKPLFTKVVRRLTFPDQESVDFIAIS